MKSAREMFEELPEPPEGKTGWPWTLDGVEAGVLEAGGNPASLPSVSLVTPSFNQGRYIEETIRSVLLQGYPRLEYAVVDGGSTDETVAILEKYGPWLSWWVSEKDRGQSHAINKGLSRATGEIVNWLCSDDWLMPGALRRVGEVFARGDADVLSGATLRVFEGWGRDPEVTGPTEADLAEIPARNPVEQPSCFFRRAMLPDPPVREDLHFTMDLRLWMDLQAAGARWAVTDEPLSMYRFTLVNKTSTGGEKSIKEFVRLFREHCRSSRDRLGEGLPTVLLRTRVPLRRASWRTRDGLAKRVLQHADWRLGQVLGRVYPRRPVEVLTQTLAAAGQSL